MEWSPIIAGGIAGLGTGFLGSVVAPWVNWGIERRRHKHKQRVELVKSWYKLVDAQLDRSKNEDLFTTGAYIKLRPYLEPAALKMIESNTIYGMVGAADGLASDPKLKMFADEVRRLEKKWRLV